MNDNVGPELLFDLALADFLLVHCWAGQMVFHLKERPFFVSDAMVRDVRATVSLLRAAPDTSVQELGVRLGDHLEAGRLVFTDDFVRDCPFWTSSLTLRHLPKALRENLARSDLVC